PRLVPPNRHVERATDGLSTDSQLRNESPEQCPWRVRDQCQALLPVEQPWALVSQSSPQVRFRLARSTDARRILIAPVSRASTRTNRERTRMGFWIETSPPHQAAS